MKTLWLMPAVMKFKSVPKAYMAQGTSGSDNWPLRDRLGKNPKVRPANTQLLFIKW